MRGAARELLARVAYSGYGAKSFCFAQTTLSSGKTLGSWAKKRLEPGVPCTPRRGRSKAR